MAGLLSTGSNIAKGIGGKGGNITGGALDLANGIAGASGAKGSEKAGGKGGGKQAAMAMIKELLEKLVGSAAQGGPGGAQGANDPNQLLQALRAQAQNNPDAFAEVLGANPQLKSGLQAAGIG